MKEKKKFRAFERGKERWLKELSMKKAIALEESLLASSLIWEWRKNFSPDTPVCLKNIIQKNRRR